MSSEQLVVSRGFKAFNQAKNNNAIKGVVKIKVSNIHCMPDGSFTNLFFIAITPVTSAAIPLIKARINATNPLV